MSESRPRRKKKSVLIEPFKQIKFGLYVFAVSVAFILASGFLFVMAFRDQYEHVMGLFNVVDENMKWALVTNDVFTTNAIRIGAVFAAYLIILFTVVFRLTHRYYGPLVSIERFVEEIKRGNYGQRVKIRERDELHQLVDRLNSMADILERRHGRHAKETIKEHSNETIKATIKAPPKDTRGK